MFTPAWLCLTDEQGAVGIKVVPSCPGSSQVPCALAATGAPLEHPSSCQSPLSLEPRAGLSRNCSPSGIGSDGRRQESQLEGERRLWLALKATDETSGREVFSQYLPLPGYSSADGQGTRQGAAEAEAGLWFSICSVKEVNQCPIFSPLPFGKLQRGMGQRGWRT